MQNVINSDKLWCDADPPPLPTSFSWKVYQSFAQQFTGDFYLTKAKSEINLSEKFQIEVAEDSAGWLQFWNLLIFQAIVEFCTSVSANTESSWCPGYFHVWFIVAQKQPMSSENSRNPELSFSWLRVSSFLLLRVWHNLNLKKNTKVTNFDQR